VASHELQLVARFEPLLAEEAERCSVSSVVLEAVWLKQIQRRVALGHVPCLRACTQTDDAQAGTPCLCGCVP